MPPKKTAAKKTDSPHSKGYSAASITVLEGLEAVRRRPGMYIGSTGPTGLHHLIWEVVDNAIDEAMAGFATHITVTLLPDHQVQVTDDGRGIPVDMHPTQKVSALEVVMTMLHAGGKFGGDGYKISGGLHGVGVSVVNALSIYTKAEVHRDGKMWIQEYKIGAPLKKVREIGQAKDTGTTITFRPDDTIFETINFEWKTIIDHLRQHTYLTKKVHMTITDSRSAEEKALDPTALHFPNPTYQFYFEGGVASYVRYLNQNKEVKHENIFYIEKEAEGVNVEIALQYSNEYSELLFAFTNNIFNSEGGTHVAGFRTALTRSINTYARNKSFLKEKDVNLSGDDVREGLTTVISIKVRDPQFEGQTKGKLGNTEARTAVEAVLGDAFLIFLEEHPKDAEGIIGKCVLAARARAAAKIARDTILRKGALEGFTLPGKLADCSSRHAEDSELFIVEGDSAGGCFSGETKVALTDGRHLSFLELIEEDKVGKQNYCYTKKDNGQTDQEKIINPRLTKAEAEVIKIIINNYHEIICTPDHQFRLVNGAYKIANELTSADSLASNAISSDNLTSDGSSTVNLTSDVLSAADSTLNIKYCVTAKEKITNLMAVYDFEVPNTHNFALANGIFVHNSAKQGRDREHQAILPLRGKVLNVERARLDKILTNNELKSLIIAMGANIGEQFDISKLRYHRIVIMTDADVDGAHIRTLLLTFFYRYYPELIKNNHIYIAQPPLYSVKYGKEMRYAYNDEEKVAILGDIEKSKKEKSPGGDSEQSLERGQAESKKTAASAKKGSKETAKEIVPEALPTAEGEPGEVESLTIGGVKINIQRYKGLGEMNPEQLWETTMDPTKRIMLQVTADDAELANETFEILMGDEVEPRKKFIQTHAKQVKNLDI